MGDLKIQVQQQQQTFNSKPEAETKTGSATSDAISSSLTTDFDLEKLLEQLKINREQYNQLITINPNFAKLDIIEKEQLVTNTFGIQFSKITDTQDHQEEPAEAVTESEDAVDTNQSDAKTEDKLKDFKLKYSEILGTTDDGKEIISLEKFQNLELDQQLSIYRYALAQNQNRDTWAKLSDEERMALAEQVDLGDLNTCKSNYAKEQMLGLKFITVLSANDYDKDVDATSQDDINDFVAANSAKQFDNSTFQNIAADAIIAYFSEHEDLTEKCKIENLDLKGIINKYKKGEGSGLEVQEIDKLMSFIKENVPEMKDSNINDMIYSYLDNKKQSGEKLDEYEQIFYSKGSAYKKSTEIFNEIHKTLNTPQTNELEKFNSSSYALMLKQLHQIRSNRSEESDTKTINKSEAEHLCVEFDARIYTSYITDIINTEGKEKAAQTALDLAKELSTQKPELAHAILAQVLEIDGMESEIAEKTKDTENAALASGHINEFGAESTATISTNIKEFITTATAAGAGATASAAGAGVLETVARVGAKLYIDMATVALQNADDTHFDHMGALSSTGNQDTDNAYWDRTTSAQDSGIQLRAGYNLQNNGTQESKIRVTTNADKFKPENQVAIIKNGIKNKVVANAVNNNGTITRLNEENQTSAALLMQNRFEQPDYTPEEQAEQLNILTDNVQKCSANNQQEIYENLMHSSNEAAAQYAQNAYETRYVPSANNTTTQNQTQTQTATSTSNYQTNPISYQTQETKPQTATVSVNNTVSSVQTSEEAIAQLNLQQEADQQKLIEIISKDNTVINKLDPQAKKAVLEVYCKRLDGAQIFALFKKNPSLYTDLLKFSGEKLNLYKDQMFKILANGSTVNMAKLAKELGIDLIKFAKQNKEYAVKIAVATKNTDFANTIIRNAAFYNLQMGSSEYFDLVRLIQKKNENLKQGEVPVYNERKAEDVISKFTFKA